ncbi:hypothetical protein [Cellulomonas sp. Y8]|uniref:hypothetical protein n=1 Tax=Cellulomonas sp. Y8 TaxID=2591145 RepID=UPI00143D522B|nr:hypothetical protein [Cellulomonas sp. Y8]
MSDSTGTDLEPSGYADLLADLELRVALPSAGELRAVVDAQLHGPPRTRAASR